MGQIISQPECIETLYNKDIRNYTKNIHESSIYISDIWSEFNNSQFDIHCEYLGINESLLFNKYILSLVHIHSDASIVYNDLTMIKNNELNFVSPKNENEWASDNKEDIYSLMYTRLNKLYLDKKNKLSWSFGGSPGVSDYQKLYNLLQQSGSELFPETCNIYKNLLLLKSIFPQVQYIDIDCEEFFNGWERVVVAFCVMVDKIGFKISLCPYCFEENWINNILVPLYQNHKVIIESLNIQFYAYSRSINYNWNQLILDSESKIGKLPKINIGLFIPEKNKQMDYSETVQQFLGNNKNFDTRFSIGLFFWNYNKVYNVYNYNIKEFNDFIKYISNNIN